MDSKAVPRTHDFFFAILWLIDYVTTKHVRALCMWKSITLKLFYCFLLFNNIKYTSIIY